MKKNVINFSLLVFLSASCLSHQDRTVASVDDAIEAIPLEDSTVTDITFKDDVIEDFTRPAEINFYERERHPSSFSVQQSGDHSIYVTKGHETLMLIAFEAYQDYRAWRKIYNANASVLADHDSLPAGVELKLPHPLNLYSPPEGRPYLIKGGDSLSKISRKVYGDMGFWKDIHQNNLKQIPYPNLIFAGFTLYYPTGPLKNLAIKPY